MSGECALQDIDSHFGWDEFLFCGTLVLTTLEMSKNKYQVLLVRQRADSPADEGCKLL